MGLNQLMEKAMATHSSTLAWRIPWTEEPEGWRLKSMESLRVGQDWVISLSLFTFMHWRRKWQPTPGFLPGESHGRGNLVGAVYGGHTECVSSSSKAAWVGTEAEKHFISGQFELLVEGWLLSDCSEWPMSNLRKQSTVWLLKFFYICLFIEQFETLLVENKKVHITDECKTQFIC